MYGVNYGVNMRCIRNNFISRYTRIKEEEEEEEEEEESIKRQRVH
jgi:hypothetical protein